MPLTSGTIIANIPAGAATAIATGLTNSASTSTDNVITLSGSEYDLLLFDLSVAFLIKPIPNIPTFSAWESYDDAIAGDIAVESARGMPYFRSWFDESGNSILVYDTLVAHTPFAVFYEFRPVSATPFTTYTAWETHAQAVSNDIWVSKGPAYFRDWWNNSGNSVLVYDTLITTAPFPPIWEIFPPSSPFTTYTAWESRATAYANDIWVSKGAAYFRDWQLNSGNAGTYEDHMDDTELGTIFKITDGIT